MKGSKRGRQDGGGGKPGKRRYQHKSPSSGNKAGIPLHTRGILISCTTAREQQGAREAIALFTESYEQLGGTWSKQEATEGGEGSAGDAPTNIAAALASEVAGLKDRSRQPFYYHQLGINSVVYLECKDGDGPSPTTLVQHACQRVSDTQENRTRFCSRFYPVEHTCYASMDKIEELAGRVVEQHFPADAQQPIEFAVVYDARAAPPLDRMEVINAFATRVPKPHKVNLGAPQKTILVNVVKAACGVAVVEQFKELCRFNIRTLALPEEEREAQREAQRAQSKAAAPAAEAAPTAAGPAAVQHEGQEEEAQGVEQGRAAQREEMWREERQQQQEEEGEEQQEGEATVAS